MVLESILIRFVRPIIFPRSELEISHRLKI